MENLEAIFLFGITIGIVIYTLIFSKIFIKTNLYLISLIKKIVVIIILGPIKYLYMILRKVIFKPVIFIFINIGKILSKYKFKVKSLKKKNKKNDYKKDFA